MDEIYRSDNVVVRRVPTADKSRWVVTFDNYGLGPGFDRPGFGEAFLQAHGVSAIHVLGRDNDWYQYPDIALAMTAVREATQGASRVMTYGSSMGGYAALRFARAAGAHAALALSPQYSLDPVKAGHEPRWHQEARRIAWLSEVDGALEPGMRPVIVYDPTDLDGWHGERIARDVEVTPIRLPYTAHPVGVHLEEIGLLRSLVFDVLSGNVDGDAVEHEARKRRSQSAVYLGELALRQPLIRPRTAIALARRAVALSPENGHALMSLGRLLSRQGEHDEALPLFQNLVRLGGRTDNYLVPYGDALVLSGDMLEASAIAREVIGLQPRAAHLQAWAGHVFWVAGHHDAARQAVRAAAKLDPDHQHFQMMLKAYGFATSEVEALNVKSHADKHFRWSSQLRGKVSRIAKRVGVRRPAAR